MKIWASLVLALTYISGQPSCGTEAGNPDAEVTKTDERPRDPDGVLALAPSTILSQAAATVTDVLSGTNGRDALAGGGLASNLIGDITVGSDPRCTSTGEPISSIASENSAAIGDVKYLDRSHDKYAAGFFYCFLVQDTNSAESLPGALVRAKIFPCLAGRIRFDGSTQSVTNSLDEAFANCAGSKRRDGLIAAGITSLTATFVATEIPEVVDGSRTWDAKITFDLSSDGQHLSKETILLKTSDGIEAYGSLAEANDQDAFFYALNKNSGQIIYERWAPQAIANDNQETTSVHNRTLISGTYSDGKFTAITNYEAAQALVFISSTITDLTYMSIAGNAQDGFSIHNRICQPPAITAANASNHCHNISDPDQWQTINAGSCFGGSACQAGHPLDQASIAFILDERITGGHKSAASWFADLKLPADDLVFATAQEASY